MSRKRIVILFILSALSFGCSVMQPQTLKGTGQSRVFQASYEQVWDATKIALTSFDLELESANQKSGELVASGRESTLTLSTGPKPTVYIESLGNSALTRVEVVNQELGDDILGTIYSQVR